jgi:Fusaric acid resistance protein-like
VLAVFVITLLGGLPVRYGLHRFVSAVLLNIWFVIALSVQAGYHLDHTQANAWAQALAWLIGSVLTLAYVTVMWLARGRTAQPQPVADFIPGSTKPVPLTKPVIMFAVIRAVAVAAAAAIAFGLHQPNADWMPVSAIAAMKPSLQDSALAAEQRLAGTIIGAAVAAVFPLAVSTKTALEVVIVVLGALAVAIRTVNYAWYCAAVAGAVLIGLDLPQSVQPGRRGTAHPVHLHRRRDRRARHVPGQPARQARTGRGPACTRRPRVKAERWPAGPEPDLSASGQART